MNLSKKELNKLKSSILKRDVFIYSYIENEMKRLETKWIKISYFKEEFKEKKLIQIGFHLLKDNEKYFEYCLTNLKGYASSQKLTLDFDAIDSLPDDEKNYLYALFYHYSDRYLFDRNNSYLIPDAAFPTVLLSKEAIEISGDKEAELEAIQESNELFRKLRYPIDGKERYKRLCNKLSSGEHIIRLIKPSFWMKASEKTAYVKIDFSQPIDIIIEVIKDIKKTIDQDKHNILTANLYEVYMGEKIEKSNPQLNNLLKKRNTIFSLEEKLTDIIYIYDCKKINMPDSKIRDNLFAYYQDKKDTDNLDDTLRIAISNYKKVLKQLNTDFSPFD